MPAFNSLMSASALLAIFSAAFAAEPSSSHASHLKWNDCHGQLRCANLTVPLDWENPKGKNITLGIGILPVADKSKRIGYLFTNPGGPGGSAIEDLVGRIDVWKSSELHKYFDIVAPDPRGTTFSTPVQCDPDVWNVRAPTIPRTEEEYHRMIKAYTARGRSCAKRSGDLINHVDTISTVKDFEAIRVALGDEPMNFLGFSYGTQLGAQYAQLFPDNIRTLALDGMLDHSEPSNDFWLQESNGYEVTVNQFFSWCERNSTCALHNTTNLPAKFDAFIDQANRSPIPAPSCNDPSFSAYPCHTDVTGYEVLRSMQGVISFPHADRDGIPGWEGLSSMLSQAMTTNNASLFADTKYDSPTRGEFAYAAIFCQDWTRTPNTTATEYMIKRIVGGVQSPHTRGQGEMWYLQAMCMNWPAPINNPPHPYTLPDRKVKTPILITNAIYDPETPIQWAWIVLNQFGHDNAALVMRNGSGHTSYSHPGATHDAIDNYLINLKVPASGTILQD